jgi:hypothetical protein
MPEAVGREGTMRRFTDPGGGTETFTETGERFSIGLPLHYTNEYSPQDQRKIEKLYKERSDIATDPDLDPEAKQYGLDQKDIEIGRVPHHITPMMREPTAQEKFDQSIVTAPDGTQGVINKSGAFAPFEASKQEQSYQDRRKDLTNMLMRDEDITKKMTFPEIQDLAENLAKREYGRLERPDESETGLAPELTNLWAQTMVTLEDDVTGRATEKQMLKAMRGYIQKALSMGIPPEVAEADFLRRWEAAEEKISFWKDDVVAPMSDELKRKAKYKTVGAVTPKQDDVLFGLSRGEGTVTVDGKTVSTTPGTVRVKDRKGRTGTVPAEDLEEAMAEGYTLVR